MNHQVTCISNNAEVNQILAAPHTHTHTHYVNWNMFVEMKLGEGYAVPNSDDEFIDNGNELRPYIFWFRIQFIKCFCCCWCETVI